MSTDERKLRTGDSDLVWIGSLSPETRWALKNYSHVHDFTEWLDDRSYISTEKFAWLLAVLKREQDTPELFPKGKWATLQVMEPLLNASIDEYLRKREHP